MKTIEQAARESADKEWGELDEFTSDNDGEFHYQHTEAFKAGVEFAQRWTPVREELPEDGEIVLIMIEDCHIDVVVGVFNGREWMCRLYVPTGHTDFIIIDKVTHWRPIKHI